ncbi:hypothetical protein BB561_002759 [Smittium simulii]|uniref:Uncharacterized protein n=1 Tax=Smittium simulii TaxID=133385 RepID=A0A2T9YPL8_9FUNG|nr:hypothetical protein BB561_002759 [Smittium simulii]
MCKKNGHFSTNLSTGPSITSKINHRHQYLYPNSYQIPFKRRCKSKVQCLENLKELDHSICYLKCLIKTLEKQNRFLSQKEQQLIAPNKKYPVYCALNCEFFTATASNYNNE